MKVDYYLPELAEKTPETHAPASLFEEVMRQRKRLTSMFQDQRPLHFVINADSNESCEEFCFMFDPKHNHANVIEMLGSKSASKHTYFSDCKDPIVTALGKYQAKHDLTFEHNDYAEIQDSQRLASSLQQALDQFLKGILK